MSGQLLLFLLTSVLAADESQLQNPNAPQQQVAILKASFDEEENSKRKRKNECLSSASNIAIKRLPLKHGWVFWFDPASEEEIDAKRNLSSEEWLNTLAKLEAFHTYGKFVKNCKKLEKRPGSIPVRLYMFRQDIRPLWEDEANKHGGKAMLCLPNERNLTKAYEVYLRVLVHVLTSDLADITCGVTFGFRRGLGTTITLWLPSTDKNHFNNVRQQLTEALALESSVKVLFKPHSANMLHAKQENQRWRAPSIHGPYHRASTLQPRSSGFVIKPPPGFEGSAPSKLDLWFTKPVEMKQEVTTPETPEPVVQNVIQVSVEAATQNVAVTIEDEKANEKARKEAKHLAQEEERRKEAQAKKFARRKRQKENKKRALVHATTSAVEHKETSEMDLCSLSSVISDEEEEVVEQEVLVSVPPKHEKKPKKKQQKAKQQRQRVIPATTRVASLPALAVLALLVLLVFVALAYHMLF